MKTAVIEPAAVPLERGWTMADLAQLVKARLTFLVLLTTAVGFYVGWQGPMDFVALLHAVLGTAFAAAGAAALNQWWEHQYDAIMMRTRTRPIPAGRMTPREGLIVGTILGIGGVVYLAVAVNWISAFLAAAGCRRSAVDSHRRFLCLIDWFSKYFPTLSDPGVISSPGVSRSLKQISIWTLNSPSFPFIPKLRRKERCAVRKSLRATSR